jgi:pyridoxine kinase
VAGEETNQKRILIVQDISCVGRCSTLAVLPVLSVSGLTCAVLPTVLLSAHTGGFGPVYRRELTEDISGILSHWQRLSLRFDAIYVGYVANAGQLRLVEQALDWLMTGHTRLYVDPVMGDHGRAYQFIQEDLIAGFRSICARADLIFPNLTEAALLLGRELKPGFEPPPPKAGELLSLGARASLVTGVEDGQGGIGVMAERKGFAVYTTFRRKYPEAFPGTGDLLASCVISALHKGAPLGRACDIACDFLDDSFRRTMELGGEPRHGLIFEPGLGRFAQALENAAVRKSKGMEIN